MEKKAKSKDVIESGDFVSISDFFFYFKDNHIWTQIRDDLRVNSLHWIDKAENGGYPKFNRNTRLKTVVCDEED